MLHYALVRVTRTLHLTIMQVALFEILVGRATVNQSTDPPKFKKQSKIF